MKSAITKLATLILIVGIILAGAEAETLSGQYICSGIGLALTAAGGGWLDWNLRR